jgi:Fe-S oxidoreductase
LIKNKRPDVDNLADFIRIESDRILSACTRCGLCFQACPMTPYAKLSADLPGEGVVTGLLALLEGGKGTPEALAWAAVCTGSGECVPACPDNVNPRLMVRLARMIGSGGTGGEVQIKMVDDLAHFPRIRAYTRLQFTEEEAKKIL